MKRVFADGGDLTVRRRLAVAAYGRWTVAWPDSVPEEQRPDPGEDLEFGYVHRMGTSGRMGRRFVRADVTITAQEFDDQQRPIALSGDSDAEVVLTQARDRTNGEPFFEYRLGESGLGGLVPGVDISIGDWVTVTIWGHDLRLPISDMQLSSDPGAPVKWAVMVGGSLLSDLGGVDRANLALRRQIMQERRERAREDARVSRQVTMVEARTTAAIAELEQATKSRAAELAEEIGTLVGEDVFGEYRADLHARLWGAQGELNRISARFMAQQEEINRVQRQAIAANSAAIKANEDALGAQRRALEALGAAQAAQTRINRLVARPLGASAGESDEDDYGRLTVWVNNAEFYAKGNWVGKVYLSVSFEALNNYNKLFVVNVTSGNRTISMAPFLFQGVRDVLLLYKVDSGGL